LDFNRKDNLVFSFIFVFLGIFGLILAGFNSYDWGVMISSTVLLAIGIPLFILVIAGKRIPGQTGSIIIDLMFIILFWLFVRDLSTFSFHPMSILFSVFCGAMLSFEIWIFYRRKKGITSDNTIKK